MIVDTYVCWSKEHCVKSSGTCGVFEALGSCLMFSSLNFFFCVLVKLLALRCSGKEAEDEEAAAQSDSASSSSSNDSDADAGEGGEEH